MRSTPHQGYAATTLVCLAWPHPRETLPEAFAAAVNPHTADLATLADTACAGHLIVTPGDYTASTGRAADLRMLHQDHVRAATAPAAHIRFSAYRRLLAQQGLARHATWLRAVIDTPPAQVFDEIAFGIDTHSTDDDVEATVEAFWTQPRILAMEQAGIEPVQEYGPGLEAHQQGAKAYAGWWADTICFGDALITTDGRLHLPGTQPDHPPLYRLQAVRDYAHRAARYLGTLGDHVTVTAAHLVLRDDATGGAL